MGNVGNNLVRENNQIFFVEAIYDRNTYLQEQDVLLRAKTGITVRVTLEGRCPNVGESVELRPFEILDEGPMQVARKPPWFEQHVDGVFYGWGTIESRIGDDLIADCAGLKFELQACGAFDESHGAAIGFSGFGIRAEYCESR